jgi:hypothetical protein
MEAFRELADLSLGLRLDNSQSRQENRELCLIQELRGFIEQSRISRATLVGPVLMWSEDLGFELPVKKITWDVNLNWSSLGDRHTEGRTDCLGHPVWTRQLDLILGDRSEDCHLIDFLEARQIPSSSCH